MTDLAKCRQAIVNCSYAPRLAVRVAANHFGKAYLLVTPTPPPRRSIGIIDLGEFQDLIYGLQSLRGKILSRKELHPGIEISNSAPVSRKGVSQSRLDEHERRFVLCKTRGSGLRIVIVIMGNPEINDSPGLAVRLLRR